MENYFEHYFEFNNIHAKFAHSLPAVKGEEFHDYYEFIFFLEGSARFVSKNIQKELTAGDILFVPKNSFHQFVVKDNNYTRLIIGFYKKEELSSILDCLGSEALLLEHPSNITTAMTENLKELFKISLTDQEKGLLFYSYILQLLFEFKKITKSVKNFDYNVSKPVHDALWLIDTLYCYPTTTVKSIANRLYLSESQLSHKFKKEMNISIYKYITKKRLSVVKDLIKSGVKVSKASKQSGFSDYSCFYRLFKQEYGYSPSAIEKEKN